MREIDLTNVAANWHMALADAVETVEDGGTIKCRTHSQAELGQRACERIQPLKTVTFTYLEDDLSEEEVLFQG